MRIILDRDSIDICTMLKDEYGITTATGVVRYLLNKEKNLVRGGNNGGISDKASS